MANKKPSSKKSSSKKSLSKKSVIDYDPLAWLIEEPDVEVDAENETAQPPAPAQTVKGRKGDSDSQISNRVAEKRTMADDDSVEENPAWGFFGDDDAAEPAASKPEDQDAEPAAFGFFDNAPVEPDNPARPEESMDENTTDSNDKNTAWGLFETDSRAASTAALMDVDKNVISLGTDLTIRSVAACKTLIDQSISNGFDVRLAAADLQKIDSAGLQLIYSLKVTLEKTAQSIHWVSGNAMINDASKLLGLPRLCEADADADPGYGFFADEDADSSANADDGYGFF